MKSKQLVLKVFILLFLVTACNNNPKPEPEAHEKETIDKGQLKAEIDDLFELTYTLFKEKDIDGLVDRFIPNGTLKLPISPLIQGHDALRENYQSTSKLEGFNLTINTLDVEISDLGDMAYVVGEFIVSFNTPQGLYEDTGITLMVLVRENNSWKIASEVLSSMPQIQ